MVKNFQFHCLFVFFLLLLQATNVHAGINGIHIAIMILEDCGRGVEMHSFGTKGPGEKFLVFQNECNKNLFKTFYKANYHRKAKRTETRELIFKTRNVYFVFPLRIFISAHVLIT